MTGLFHWTLSPSSTKGALRRKAKRIGGLGPSRILTGTDRMEALFGPLWRCSQDLLLVCDRQGTVRAANPAWTRLLGWQPTDLLGRHPLDFVDPEDHGASLESSLLPGECRMRHKDGSTRWVAWVVSSEDGLVFASGRDVTAEKALAGAEEQLRQSRKMHTVGQLTGGIAHDFNNLLTGMIGNLELLQLRIAAGRTDGMERYAAMAMASAERAAALTQRLLTFARPQPPGPNPVDANRLLSGMECLLRRALDPAISLEMALDDALWPVLCDSNQLENAVLNLAINARDAMPDGGRLRVETANAQLDAAYAETHGGVSAGQYVAIAVTDTGFGMEPEVAAKAFDPFFTTKPTGRGTGLGLSMLHDFVKQSNGHVRIDSEPGVGTTFRLYFPRCGEDGSRDRALMAGPP